MENAKNKTLLLVEDEVLIAMARKIELEEYGYTVLTVTTGEKAVAQSKENNDIDLILMDINLGSGIDGTEAAEIILTQQDIPIIFLSSHMEREVVEKTEKITSYGYVVKSSNITVLDASIKMAFKLFNAHKEINKRNMLIEMANENLRVTIEDLEETNDRLNTTNEALTKTETNLHESKKEYKSTLDGLLVGVVVHDADTNIVLSNPEASKLLGLTAEQLSGKDATDPAWMFVYEDTTPMKLKDYPVNRVVAKKKPLMNYVLGIIRPNKKDITWINVNAKPLFNSDNKLEKIIVNFIDITDQKLAEKKLQESEAKIRNKLKAITEPDGQIDSLELSDIIDTKILQNLMEGFYKLTGMLCAVLDLSGKILVSVGWQDICTKFHRCNPETLKNCIESDTILTKGVPEGTFKAYRCKNNMWDIVTPLFIGGRHIGNIFMGQYFLKGEEPDVEFFRNQARKYGFDEDKYLTALKKVPRFSKETINTAMHYYAKLAGIISTLSYSTIKQSRLLDAREKAEADLQKKQYYLSKAQELGKIGTWELDIQKNSLRWTEENYKIFGIPFETKMNYELFLDCIHPEDRTYVNEKWTAGLNKQPYDIEHRILIDGEVKWVREKAEIEFDESDNPIRAIGFTQDITDRKQAEEKLQESGELNRQIIDCAHEGIIVYGKDLHYKAWNPFMESISGVKAEDVLGKHPIQVFPFLKEVGIESRLNIALKGEIPQPVEFPYNSKGKTGWTLDNSVPLRNSKGEIEGVIASVQDITDRKKMEDKIKFQLEEKELILKEIHHRIKNNFASIVNLLSLQSKSSTNPEAISALKDAIGRVNSLKVMYDKILLTGTYKTSSIKEYLDSLINDLLLTFPKEINIKVERQIDDLQLDPKRLVLVGIIVNELITNIMKYAFTDRNSGLIKVILNEKKGSVSITIQDNGKGLPEGFDISESEGFGLMLTKMLVQQLNGTFTMENETGLKTVIEFSI